MIITQAAIKAVENGQEIATVKVLVRGQTVDGEAFVSVGFSDAELWTSVMMALKVTKPELAELILGALIEYANRLSDEH